MIAYHGVGRRGGVAGSGLLGALGGAGDRLLAGGLVATPGHHAGVLGGCQAATQVWDSLTCGEVCLLGICLCGEAAAERGGGW